MANRLTKGIGNFADIAFQLAMVLAITLGIWWLVYLVASDVWNAAWGAFSSGKISPEWVALIVTGCLIVAGYLIGLLLYGVRQLENRVEWLGDRVTQLEESQRSVADKLKDR